MEKDDNILGEDVREGLIAIVSVRLRDPQFEGQTKTKLGNSEVKGIVESTVKEDLMPWLEVQACVAMRIVSTSKQGSKASMIRRIARSKTSANSRDFEPNMRTT